MPSAPASSSASPQSSQDVKPTDPSHPVLQDGRAIATRGEAALGLALPVVAPLLLLPAAGSEAATVWLLGLFAAGLAVSGGVSTAAHVTRGFPRSAAMASIEIRTISAAAAIMGLLSGTVVYLAIGPSDVSRCFVFGMAVALIANASFLGPVRAAYVTYLALVTLGGFVGFTLIGDLVSYVLGVALFAYAGFVALGCEKSRSRCLAAISSAERIRSQREIVELLMPDASDASDRWPWRFDRAERLSDVSDALAVALEQSTTQLKNAPFRIVFGQGGHGMPLPGGAQEIAQSITDRRAFHDTLVECRVGKATKWWRLSGVPVFDHFGTYEGYRGLVRDVTSTIEHEKEVSRLKHRDQLTGLANREHFRSFAETECANALARNRSFALFLIDIDGLKEINDRFGHLAGDALLRTIARRLEAAVPRAQLIARLGSDDFAVIWESPHHAQAEVLARTILGALGSSYGIESADILVSASVGVALVPDHADKPDALLRRAELALARAKAAGKGHYRIFQPEYELVLLEQRELENDIKLALARQEFELHYQPLLDLATGRIVCFEALLRWTSPTRGPVSPASFIPVAESAGLITAIDRWVVMHACRHAAQWDGDVQVAVNISPQHFKSPELIDDINVALGASGLQPARLQIEVTEGVFLDMSTAAIANLHAIRRKGIKIALDDFGTGYSSLNYLINFPVDKIKIDRSFVRDLVARHENRAVVDALLTLARKLSIRVTAEGVETIEQVLALKLRRCDDVQGYLISRPRPADEVAAMLAEVPGAFRAMVPMLFESPLALALAMKKKSA